MYPTSSDLKPIQPNFIKELPEGEKFLPYKRDEKLARKWAVPGIKGLEHRIGGLEKEHETGNISYDPENHEFMVKLRAEKIERIADFIPDQTIDQGPNSGPLVIVGWGSTYGAIKTAVREALNEGIQVTHIHIRNIHPFPKNLGQLLASYDHVLVPEMNNGQLVRVLRDKFLVPAEGMNKIKGVPFTAGELLKKIKSIVTHA
jgi:2-oxoglutarate ferredoxin oxidoreductase subunit alpha